MLETDELLNVLSGVRFKFWACPDCDRSIVKWEGDKAVCQSCGRSNKMNPMPLNFDRPQEREQWLERCHLRGLDADARRSTVEQWLQQQVAVVGAKEQDWGLQISEGVIQEICDGVWGYGGDRWAVKIDGEFYPSSYVLLAAD